MLPNLSKIGFQSWRVFSSIALDEDVASRSSPRVLQDQKNYNFQSNAVSAWTRLGGVLGSGRSLPQLDQEFDRTEFDQVATVLRYRLAVLAKWMLTPHPGTEQSMSSALVQHWLFVFEY